MSLPVETASGNIQRLAGFQQPHTFCQVLDRGDQLGSSRLGVSSVSPNICATFFSTYDYFGLPQALLQAGILPAQLGQFDGLWIGLGPTFIRGDNPSNSPRSPCLRQVVR